MFPSAPRAIGGRTCEQSPEHSIAEAQVTLRNILTRSQLDHNSHTLSSPAARQPTEMRRSAAAFPRTFVVGRCSILRD
jgi:hypothetical protein